DPALPRGGRPGRTQEGRLGVGLEKPGDTLVEQLGLTRGQGLVIGQVKPDSAAAKAGLKPHDVLVRLNGKPVPSDASEFQRLLQGIQVNTPVDAGVGRKGKEQTIKGLTRP